MNIKKWFVIAVVVVGWLAAPGLAPAGTFAELDVAVDSYYASGDISDTVAYLLLSDLVDEAAVTTDVESENSLRGSISDVCYAYRGSGITAEAADDLISIAAPQTP